MKYVLILTVACLISALATFAAEEPKGTLHIQNNDVRQVLAYYKELSGLELIIDSRAQNVSIQISLRIAEPLPKSEVMRRIEKALLDRARIVITHLDDKRVSVTYNDALSAPLPGK